MFRRPLSLLSRALVVGTLAAASGCAETSHTGDRAKPPGELIVYDTASQVHRVSRPDGRYELTYELHMEYPAEAVVARIRATLPPDTWHPLTSDWLNPGNPSGYSHGWSDILDGTQAPSTRVDVWNAEWRDAAGNLVIYSLRYVSELSGADRRRGGPDNAQLKVTARFVPADVVIAMRKQLGIMEPLR
jgi:hypothetical protein